MKKKILFSLSLFFFSFFVFLSSPKATYFYRSVNLNNFNGFSSLFNNNTGIADAHQHFMDLDNWEDFYYDLSSYIINQGWTTSFPTFDNVVVVAPMVYENYSGTYFPHNIIFCDKSDFYISSNTYYCNGDSTIRINSGYNGIGASVYGGSFQSTGLGSFGSFAWYSGQPPVGMYSNDNIVINDSSFQTYFNSYSIPYYLIPSKLVYTYQFYLDNSLVLTTGCTSDGLNVAPGGYSCVGNFETISANKVVAKVFLGQSYRPTGWWYNNLNFSNVTDRYYNSLVSGFLPDNTNLTSLSFTSLYDPQVSYSTNLLDVRSTIINRQSKQQGITNTYTMFTSAFNFPSGTTSLSSYFDSLTLTFEFPTQDIDYINVWQEGFNNLSDNYIQENIDLANGGIQQNIIETLNGNTVSTDEFFNFFTDFSLDSHGLSSFIIAPISFLQQMGNTTTCSPLSIPLIPGASPIILPCMSSFYSSHIYDLYFTIQFIMRGLIIYLIVLDCYNFIKKIQSPDLHKIEVFDL